MMSPLSTSNMKFVDIVVLIVMREYELANGGKPCPRLSLWKPGYSLVNEWIAEKQIIEKEGYKYTYPVTASGTISDAIVLLKKLGFIELEKPNNQKGKHLVTNAGIQFLQQIGDNWRAWPVRIPLMEDNALDFENAEYVPDWDENNKT